MVTLTDPFNLDNLCSHFKFEITDIDKTELDITGNTFHIYFKKGKESIALNFYKTLEERGCFPLHFPFSNSVCLNKHNVERIIEAAEKPFFHLSGGDLVLRKTISKKEKFELKGDPFNLTWFNKHFKVDPQRVKKAYLEFSRLSIEYKIFFYNPEESTNLEKILREKGVPARSSSYLSCVTISYDERHKLCKSAGESSKKIDPSNLEFFTKYLLLDQTKVEKCIFGYHYEIWFNDKDYGRDYYKHLEKLGVYPKRYDFNEKRISMTNMNDRYLMHAAMKIASEGHNQLQK